MLGEHARELVLIDDVPSAIRLSPNEDPGASAGGAPDTDEIAHLLDRWPVHRSAVCDPELPNAVRSTAERDEVEVRERTALRELSEESLCRELVAHEEW